ncbi:hypothetical protein DBW_2622 [Desulfuromonas sp. DDH964]|uniref:hypothetical protein n=1 Tax=Desulfuromonas sp. DDH964 TaxID=1823759 RepID=UPI00078D9584|nr:hypothetical protein [Desulfuromonas sp. DDH964]AMV72949.1 hypothetical protein DBW_2622 [Desulfuromonas sp. DDH964]
MISLSGRLLLGCLLLLPTTVGAESLSLADCLALARQQNPTLQAAALISGGSNSPKLASLSPI